MAARATGQIVVRKAKPLVSSTHEEARRRVLTVYRKWQEYAPRMWWEHKLTHMTLPDFRLALKQQFLKNADLKDLRVIDRYIHQAEVELVHCQRYINNYDHIHNFMFKENIEPKPTDFLSKFFAGKD